MDLHRRLREAWSYAREEWADSVAAGFEEQYWNDLDLELSRLLAAAEDLVAEIRSAG
jgi:hypothetical protein